MRLKKTLRIVLSLSVIIVVSFGASCVHAFVYADKVAAAKSLAHYTMGYIYDLNGETKHALLEYQQAAQFDERSYIVRLRLGTIYARLNMFGRAIDELKLVNQYNPEEIQSHYLLALIYSTLERYNDAAEEYEYILKSVSQNNPDNIEIYGYLGQLYYSQKKYNQAVQQFERILEIEPENVEVLYLLGSLYLEVGERDKAIVVLEKAIEINPVHDASLNTLGYLYAENNINLDQAVILLEKALEVSPMNGAYLDSLGWAFYKKGKYEEALKVLKEADEILKDPVIYNHLAEVCLKLNKNDEAITYWELSLQLWPEQEEVINKIQRLKNVQVSR